MSKFTQGDNVRLTINVTDAAGLPADPPALLIKVKPPVAALINGSYPGTIVKTAVGAYRFDVPLTEKGLWQWRWETVTPYAGALQGDLTVVPANL